MMMVKAFKGRFIVQFIGVSVLMIAVYCLLVGCSNDSLLILSGYFELTMYLQLSGKLDQYINVRYSYLAYISMVLSFILALVQLYTWMKNIKVHSHLTGKIARLTSPFILVFPVLIGLLVPTVTLDSTTVSAKGYTFPLAAGASKTESVMTVPPFNTSNLIPAFTLQSLPTKRRCVKNSINIKARNRSPLPLKIIWK